MGTTNLYWLIDTLKLTQQELANFMGVSRRTVAYSIDDSVRMMRRGTSRLEDRLFVAIQKAEAAAGDEGRVMPEIPPGLPPKFITRRFRLDKEIRRLRHRMEWLEKEYPALVRAHAVSSHLDLTGLHDDPNYQRLVEATHNRSRLRLQLKIRKTNYAKEMWELRVRIALLEAEKEVLNRMW